MTKGAEGNAPGTAATKLNLPAADQDGTDFEDAMHLVETEGGGEKLPSQTGDILMPQGEFATLSEDRARLAPLNVATMVLNAADPASRATTPEITANLMDVATPEAEMLSGQATPETGLAAGIERTGAEAQALAAKAKSTSSDLATASPASNISRIAQGENGAMKMPGVHPSNATHAEISGQTPDATRSPLQPSPSETAASSSLRNDTALQVQARHMSPTSKAQDEAAGLKMEARTEAPDQASEASRATSAVQSGPITSNMRGAPLVQAERMMTQEVAATSKPGPENMRVTEDADASGASNSTSATPRSGEGPNSVEPAVKTAMPVLGELGEARISPVLEGGSVSDVEPDLAVNEVRAAETLTARAEISGHLRTELPRHVALQLADVARHQPDRPVELTLSPEELGRLRLTFSGDLSAMTVSVTVERPETLDLMRRHIDLLAEEMRAIGYGDVSFSFEHSGNGSEGSGETSDEASAGFSGTQIAEDAEQHRPLPMTRLDLSGATGIDIRL